MGGLKNRFGAILFALSALVSASCTSGVTGVAGTLDGSYTLLSENGVDLPTDPKAPNGCCLTLGGTLALYGNSYQLKTSNRNKNTQVAFENSETGTYTVNGTKLTFTRTGGGGVAQPFLLAPGTVNGSLITLLYGDEGPGSNQTAGLFAKLNMTQ